MQPAAIDPLLEPLLLLTGDEEVNDLLSHLIADHAEPVIRGIIRHKLHLSQHGPEQTTVEDLSQETILQLVTTLQRFRSQPETQPIADLRGLAAIIAHRTCSRWMRQNFPERHAFKNRLYYLLTRQRGFAIWRGSQRRMLTGFSAWRDEMSPVSADRIDALLREDSLLLRLRLLANNKQADWSETLAAVFDFLGRPIEFDKLVRALADLMQIQDAQVESTDRQEEGNEIDLASTQADTSWRVEKRLFLQRLWEEVCQLPLNQRVALLLNLRDAEGRGCIALFPATGIANLRQLAESMEMSAEELAAIWNELPLEDARIAELLQLTRQQVINVRKSARDRLSRRLKGFF
jgi:DNA-directed RNA polymerase specialized sigma24 family protein